MKEFKFINKVSALKVWSCLSFSYWKIHIIQIHLFVLFLALLVQSVSGRCLGWGLWKAVSVCMSVAQMCWLAQPLLPMGALFQLIVDEPKCSLCQLRMPLTLHLCFPACTATLRNNDPTTGTLRKVQLLTMPMPCDSQHHSYLERWSNGWDRISSGTSCNPFCFCQRQFSSKLPDLAISFHTVCWPLPSKGKAMMDFRAWLIQNNCGLQAYERRLSPAG